MWGREGGQLQKRGKKNKRKEGEGRKKAVGRRSVITLLCRVDKKEEENHSKGRFRGRRAMKEKGGGEGRKGRKASFITTLVEGRKGGDELLRHPLVDCRV